jgi:hypothetical protein
MAIPKRTEEIVEDQVQSTEPKVASIETKEASFNSGAESKSRLEELIKWAFKGEEPTTTWE